MAQHEIKRPPVNVFIATTVMLSFISFWRAAAIVLSDLASSAYYAGGDAEKVIGKSAPWFILAVMLFSYAVRAVYIEASSMFVRGGVYRVVREAMGETLAKLSVSALLFDYILTGPISAVTAGQYLAGFIQEGAQYLKHPVQFNQNYFAAGFGILAILYFWWKNIEGIHESSDKALWIMKVTTIMVVILIAWSLFTLAKVGINPPPLPSLSNMKLDHEFLGWLHSTPLSHITWVVLIVGMGHSVLAMSGEETLAQVNREIEHPKLKNLQRAGLVIFAYSLVFTSFVSFLAVMIIPDDVRPNFFANLIGGLAMYLYGPTLLKLIFHFFVVFVGVLILSGAANTAILGANGVLNRLSETKILTAWFQRPHRKYGTSYRTINLIAALQVATILLSRGNFYLLAALYAFGVVWSFAFNGLAVLVLRYTQPEHREWKVPGNIKIGGTEVPVGLGVITVSLFLIAVANLLTKKDATIAGVAFSAVFYVVLTISERYAKRESAASEKERFEQFRVFDNPELDFGIVGVRPGNVLVTVRDPNRLYHLKDVLSRTDTNVQDVVVMSARLSPRRPSLTGSTSYEAKDVFDVYEQDLFSKVVALAEKLGKPVKLLVVPGTNVFDAAMMTAQRLESSSVVSGLSTKLSEDEQAKYTGDAWERLPDPKPRLQLEITRPDGGHHKYFLGPHEPRLRPDDLELLHKIWLEITSDPRYAGLHHYHVVRLALEELQKRILSGEQPELLRKLLQERDGR
ncbi:MAG TPA: APC family permease [Terriglobales bacterium]|nr:APC family permease [Terriglobales bacterium]